MSLVRKLVPRPGSKIPFFSSPQRTGGPSGPLSLAYSLRPNTLYRGLGVDGTDGKAPAPAVLQIDADFKRIYIQYMKGVAIRWSGIIRPLSLYRIQCTGPIVTV